MLTRAEINLWNNCPTPRGQAEEVSRKSRSNGCNKERTLNRCNIDLVIGFIRIYQPCFRGRININLVRLLVVFLFFFWGVVNVFKI